MRVIALCAARDAVPHPSLSTIEVRDELEEAVRRGVQVPPQLEELGFEGAKRPLLGGDRSGVEATERGRRGAVHDCLRKAERISSKVA